MGSKRDAEKLEKFERSIQSQKHWFELGRNFRFSYLSKARLSYIYMEDHRCLQCLMGMSVCCSANEAEQCRVPRQVQRRALYCKKPGLLK